MQASETIARQGVWRTTRDGLELPPLPGAAGELFAYARHADSQIATGKLSHLIESDQTGTTRPLRIANTSNHGCFSPMTQIRQALMGIVVPESPSSLSRRICRKLLPRCPRMTGFKAKLYRAHSSIRAAIARMAGEADSDCAALSRGGTVDPPKGPDFSAAPSSRRLWPPSKLLRKPSFPERSQRKPRSFHGSSASRQMRFLEQCRIFIYVFTILYLLF